MAAQCNRTWLWHPEDDEFCSSLLCCLYVVDCYCPKAFSMRSGMTKDRVDLVSAWYIEMKHSNMVNIELLEVCCQRIFVLPHEASSPVAAMLTIQEPMRERERQSWCGSTPLRFKIGR